MKKKMKRRFITRLASGALAAVLAVTSMHLSDGLFGMRAVADDEVNQPVDLSEKVDALAADEYSGKTAEVSQVTLLAGEVNPLRGSTVEETIKNYEDFYLLGIGAEFCVFLKGDFTVHDSDAEGRIAVGGNINIQNEYGSYAIGTGDFVTHVDLDTLLNMKNAATIILGGEVKDGQISDVYYEDGEKYEQWQNDHKSTKKLVVNDESTTVDNIKSWGTIPYPSNGEWAKLSLSQTYITHLLDFGYYFNTFLPSRRDELAEGVNDLKLKPESTTTKEVYDDFTVEYNNNTITFTYTGDDEEAEAVYFYLSDAFFEHFRDATRVEYRNIPKLPEGRPVLTTDGTSETWDYAYIVVNVAEQGDSNGEIHLSNVNGGTVQSKKTYIYGKDQVEHNISYLYDDGSGRGNNHPGVTSLLYNFYNIPARENNPVNLVLSANFQGTIFALNAHATDEKQLGKASNQGHLSGALIADSFEGSTEFGYRPYAGAAQIIEAESDYGIKFYKNDSDGKLLKGATISIYEAVEAKDADGNTYYVKSEKAIATAESSEKAALIFEKLGEGKYILCETNAPDGYALSDKEIYFEITDGDVVNVDKIPVGTNTTVTANVYTVVDGTPTGEFEITREEADDIDKYVPLKSFETFNWDANNGKYFKLVAVNCATNIIEKVQFYTTDSEQPKVIDVSDVVVDPNGWSDVVGDVKYSSGSSVSNNFSLNNVYEIKFLIKSDATASAKYMLQMGANGGWSGDDSTSVTIKSIDWAGKEFTFYSSPVPTEYYKIATEEYKEAGNPYTEKNGKDVVATKNITTITKTFYAKSGKLTVYSDNTFAEAKATETYDGAPLDITKNIYKIGEKEYTFSAVTSETEYTIKGKNGETLTDEEIEAVKGKFKLIAVTGGYVVYSNGAFVTPMQILNAGDNDGNFEIINDKNGITICKQNRNGDELSGAEFELDASSVVSELDKENAIQVTITKKAAAKDEAESEVETETEEEVEVVVESENEEKDGDDAEKIVVELYDAEGHTSFTFEGGATITGLPAGTYTLKETKAPNGYELLEDVEFTITIDNDGKIKSVTQTPEPEGDEKAYFEHTESSTTVIIYNERIVLEDEVELVKTWTDDYNNALGSRPSKIEVTVEGTADGAPTITKTVTLTAENSWKAKIKFTTEDIAGAWSDTENNELPDELPMYYYPEGGDPVPYDYSYTEANVALYEQVGEAGYTYDDTNTKVVSVTFENKLKKELGDLEINKTWVDYTGFLDGFAITAEDHPKVTFTLTTKDIEFVAQTRELTAGSSKVTFETLPLYKYTIAADGTVTRTLIEYTLTETVNGYTGTATGYTGTFEWTFTLTGSTTFTEKVTKNVDVTNNYEKTQVTINKEWIVDDENLKAEEAKARPSSITVVLIGTVDSGTTVYSKEVTLSADSWTATETNLPKYYFKDGKAKLITYSVSSETGVSSEYTFGTKPTSKDSDGNPVLTVTNTYGQEHVELKLKKVWNDTGYWLGDIRQSVTFEVIGTVDGVKVYPAGDSHHYVNIGNDGNWTATVTNLPKYHYNNGVQAEIVYTITETNPPAGFTPSTATKDNEGYLVIENSVDTATTKIDITKNWSDNNNALGIRPDEIKVKVIGKVTINGTDTVVYPTSGDHIVTVTGTGNTWTAEVTNLPENYYHKAEDGTVTKYTIVYSIEEVVPTGYISSFENENDPYAITNTVDDGTTQVKITKIWEDNGNPDGKRPTSITAVIKATITKNGAPTEVEELRKQITIFAPGWVYVETKLPVYYYEKGADGNYIKYPITYTVEEVGKCEGYKKGVVSSEATNDFIITNTIEETPDNPDNPDKPKEPEETTVTTSVSEESTTVSTTEPTTASTTEPTTASTTKETTASTTEPTTASTTKETTASTTEPTTASTTKETTASTTEPTTASTTKETTASTTEPTTASTTKETTASTTEPTTASTTKETTVSTTEPTTASTTASTTESTTESTSEAPETSEAPVTTTTPTTTNKPTQNTPNIHFGSLTISKTVSGNGELDREFMFVISFTDASGNGVSGNYYYSGSKSGYISNGGMISLKHGESITISGIPAGIHYSVTELTPDDYMVTSEGAVGMIAPNFNSHASFVNTEIIVIETPSEGAFNNAEMQFSDVIEPHAGGNVARTIWVAVMAAALIGVFAAAVILEKKRG